MLKVHLNTRNLRNPCQCACAVKSPKLKNRNFWGIGASRAGIDGEDMKEKRQLGDERYAAFHVVSCEHLLSIRSMPDTLNSKPSAAPRILRHGFHMFLSYVQNL